jgi:beta-galactosidase GanA
VLNHDVEKQTITLPAVMHDLLTGRQLVGSIELGPYDVLILRAD